MKNHHSAPLLIDQSAFAPERSGGGLDEDYHPAYYEEADLCFRAKLMGYDVRMAPRDFERFNQRND